MNTPRPPYPSDVTDEEWAFVAPYLTLLSPDAPQRKHDPREVFNAVCWLVHTGAGRPLGVRYLPHDFPPWAAVHQQVQRWIAAECFVRLVDDLQALLRVAAGRAAEPTAIILDGRTIASTPASGHRAGYNGYQRTQGTTIHAAVDTPGDLTALTLTRAGATPADVQRSFAWVSRFRRLARDYERLPKTLIGFHFLAFACLMLHRAAGALPAGP